MREIRMLRAMWRVLETEPRTFLNGHAGGNAGYSLSPPFHKFAFLYNRTDWLRKLASEHKVGAETLTARAAGQMILPAIARSHGFGWRTTYARGGPGFFPQNRPRV